MRGELSERELSFALDTVYRFNATEDTPSFARLTLSLLCSAIPCIQGIFTLIDDVDGMPQSSNTYVWGNEAHYLDKFKEGGYERDGLLAAASLKPNSYAMRDSDLMPESERMNSRLYQDIYIPEGVHYVMRITLIWQSKMIGQFAFFRPREADDFSNHDLALGNLLAPHLTLKLAQLKRSPAEGGRNAQARNEFKLTPRELEVVTLVAEGLSDEKIAEKLFVSNSTVKKHLYNAYSKMGVSNRLQLKMALGSD